MHEGQSVGTASAGSCGHKTYIVTARHRLESGDKLLPAIAFGQELRFVAALPAHDLAVFKVDTPPADALPFRLEASRVGQRLSLFAYPQIRTTSPTSVSPVTPPPAA